MTSRHISFISLLAALFLFASVGEAKADDTNIGRSSRGGTSIGGSSWDRDPAFVPSSETFTLELRFGGYQPDLGTSSAGRSIFQHNFGGDIGPMLGFEVDIHAYRIPYVGPLALGIGFAWGEWNGAGRAPDGKPTSQTSLMMLPLSVMAVLRIDSLARNLNIPFVFTGKFGIDAAYFRGVTENVTSVEGFSMGLRWAAQAAFELDFIDPRSARRLDDEWGINHSAIYGEIYQSFAGGFSPNMLPLGAIGWSAGLQFTF